MSLADNKYNDWMYSIEPHSVAYADFWRDLMQSFGFTQVKKADYPWRIYRTFNHPKLAGNFEMVLAPCTYKGIWLSGNDRNGTNFRKKILTENGLHKFLKYNRLGDF